MTLQIRSGSVNQASRDVAMLQKLHIELADSNMIDEKVGRMVMATESISEADTGLISNKAASLQATLSAVVSSFGVKMGSDTMVRESAAVGAALCAAATGDFIKRDTSLDSYKARTETVFTVGAETVPGYHGERVKVAEAFDTRETRSAVLYTMAYNYALARQDEFGETLWPTLTLPSDQVGFGIVVNRLTVFRGAVHTTDGKPVNFGKIDLMRAEADPTVLRKDRTRAFPVARANNADKLVPAAKIAPYDYDNEGEIISTAPYRVGVSIGYLGMCQTDAQLSVGSATERESIDPAISLERIYVEIGDDIVAFNTYSLPSANYTYATQGVDRQRQLNFENAGLRLTPATKTFDGSDLVTLEKLATGKYTAVVRVVLNGGFNVETSIGAVYHGAIELVKLVDENGDMVPASHADYIEIATAINEAKTIGYDLRKYRTNLSMRERGDFIDRTNFTQLYEVPLLSPITAQRPQNTDGALDGGDFEALVTATRFRLKNDAVTALLEHVQRLDDYDINGPTGDDIPAALGASRYHLRPSFYAENINVTGIVDSVKSSERLRDLHAAIVNKIRDIVFRLHVQSEYQAAAAALGLPINPTVVIATDPYIHRYIQIDGELRTLTDKFEVRVVSTLDVRMRGKLYIGFGVFDENRNQAPCILNTGNLVWAPEVVLHASVPRGEYMARETIVQPRYLFVAHTPVGAMLQISGISDVFNKIPLLLKSATEDSIVIGDPVTP